MIYQVLPYTRQIKKNGYIMLLQLGFRANSRAHQDSRTAVCPSTDNHLFLRVVCPHVTIRRITHHNPRRVRFPLRINIHDNPIHSPTRDNANVLPLVHISDEIGTRRA